MTSVLTSCKDEIGELIENNSLMPVSACRKKSLADTLLPCERMGETWPDNIAKHIDSDLATKFPLINLNAILRVLHHKKFADMPAPRFAAFDAFGDGNCVVLMDKEKNPGPAALEAAMVMGNYAKSLGAPASTASIAADGTAIRITGGTMISWDGPWATVTSRHTERVRLSTKFSGIIPAEVRQRIRDTKQCFDKTLLIQEVVEWNATVERIADPLVIGVKNGVHYLVDRFDTTSLEDYVAREFSVSPPQ
jgi:hypothetical protein